MPPRSWKFRIDDIKQAIEDIFIFSANLESASDLENNRMAYYAILKAFEIIGEAATQIPEPIQQQYLTIPWRELKDFRNILAHEYFGIDSHIIWSAIKTELPALKEELNKILV